MTTLVKLLAQETDSQLYTTYVFLVLDNSEETKLDNKYIMCVRWPNWEHRALLNGEIGYLSFKIIRAGIDTWYDGNTFVPYKYSNIQFERFISIQPDETTEFKM